MKEPREMQCTAAPESRRQGVQASPAIEVDVEAGIENVEAGDPEDDGGGERPGKAGG